MKKLMIAAFAVAFAAIAQAASVDWKVTATASELNYKVYLIIGSEVNTDWGSAAEVAAAAVATDVVAKYSRSYYAGATEKSEVITKDSDFYFVIIDADATKYAVSALMDGSEYVYDTAANPPESSKGNMSWSTVGASYTDFGGSSVPEPTSALMLLVGLAGLALKRKVA